MENENIPVVILGAGIAGLGAAYRASVIGKQAVVFEARDTAGGLLDNFSIDGFRFDYAVHLSFATEMLVRNIFDRTNYYTHPSDSFCFEKDRWLKHPVQNNLYPLPVDERVKLIKSFHSRPTNHKNQDYESWLRHQYGDDIAERYPIRYTKKYWGTEPSNLSINWIGNRMRRAKFDEILYGALTSETPNQYYAKEMRYPKEGGYKSFIQPLIDVADIRCGSHCNSINIKEKKIRFDNGLCVRYDKLINTLPLPELVKITENVPLYVERSAMSLKATSIDLVSIGFNSSIVNDLWFYIYDEDIYASRAYSPSVKSPDNAPVNCSSLQFEIYSRGELSSYKPADIKTNTVAALEKMGIAKPKDIVFIDHRRVRYANVIFDIGMEDNRDQILSWYNSQDVVSCGRFGEWDYLWSNQSLESGYYALD